MLGCNGTNGSNTAAGGGLTIAVDDSTSHSKPNSVKVASGDSCGVYFLNSSALANLGKQVYGRFWASFSGPPTANHNGFMSMYDGTDPNFLSNFVNGESQLRLGFQGNVIVWNDKKTDATLPDIDTQGEAQSVATTPNKWDCIEFHVDESTGHIEFWFNGAATPTTGLSYDGTSAAYNVAWNNAKITSFSLKTFGLGWLGLNNQYSAWYDDVALSPSGRIGCN